ncbi:MAG: NUDIX hydrolase [Bacteroidia bacterium]
MPGYKALARFSANDIHAVIQEITGQSPGKGFHFACDDPFEAYLTLRKTLPVIQAAGGIVWNNERDLLMIFRRGKWDLPKGKIEEGESIETAALREVEEESGIGKLRLIEKFDTTYHIYPEREKWILKETHWYEMISKDIGKTVPQISEGITEVSWIPRLDIGNKINDTYASMRELINRVLAKGYTSGME